MMSDTLSNERDAIFVYLKEQSELDVAGVLLFSFIDK